MIKRQLIIKLHVVLAAFFLSIAAMFFVTGALYTADIKPDSSKDEYRAKQETPLRNEAVDLENIARREMRMLGLKEPLGNAKLRKDKKRNSFMLVWKGLNHNVTIRPSSIDPKTAVITLVKPSWYSRLMSLHKGNGGDAFEALAIGAAIALLLQLASGVVLALQVARLRRLTIFSMVGGAVVFAGLVAAAQVY